MLFAVRKRTNGNAGHPSPLNMSRSSSIKESRSSWLQVPIVVSLTLNMKKLGLPSN